MTDFNGRIHITNDEIRKRTKFTDALCHAKCLKWDFCGHIQRLTDERWTRTVEKWQPTDAKRNRGRQKKRWKDEIEEIGLGRWREKANERKTWKILRESFVHNGLK